MSLGKRLRNARKMRGFTQKELARCIDAKHNSISNWENGQNMPDPVTIERLCKALNISPNYLLLGDAMELAVEPTTDSLTSLEMSLIQKYRSLDNTGKGAVDSLVDYFVGLNATGFVPVLMTAQGEPKNKRESVEARISVQGVAAGTGTWLGPDDFQSVLIESNATTQKAAFYVPVEGDSMEPRFYDGDILIVEDSTVQVGEIGIFTLNNHGYVKKLGEGELLSLNPQYAPIPLDDDTVCNGRVIGVLNPDWIIE